MKHFCIYSISTILVIVCQQISWAQSDTNSIAITNRPVDVPSASQNEVIVPPAKEKVPEISQPKTEKKKPTSKPTTPQIPASPRRMFSTYQEVKDPHFAYCGEYMGYASLGGKFSQFGLQVAVRKDGEFVATLYQDGLPGDGWKMTPVERSKAKLNNEKLEFSFADFIVHVDKNSAMIKTSSATTSYTLKKLLRQSPTLGLTPPQNAVILFKPGLAEKLVNPKMTENGLLQEGTETTEAYEDFRIHVEFTVPYLPDDDDQKRGNSGIYIQSRYEIQILDSFGEDPRFNSIGALYRQKPADLNMSLPPLNWQTYDIWFEAAKFAAEGKKSSPARVTVFLNGVPVHYNRELLTKTGAGKPEGSTPLSTKFQDHSDPVRFRSIWIQPGKQPLPPNKTLAAEHNLNQTTPVLMPINSGCESCYSTADVSAFENIEIHHQSAYPYSHPENYTRQEPYGSYGKLWPFKD